MAGVDASDSIFSVNHVDANTMKVNLIERMGKAFGLDLDDFANAGVMAREIQEEVAKMTPEAIHAVEKSVGLDTLAISLSEMLDAMNNPGGSADEKLDAALREKAGELFDEKSGVTHGAGLDDVGRYSDITRFG